MDYSRICQGWIYTITNKVNGKMYVGKTNNYKRRMDDHFKWEQSCPHLKNAINKYGAENFETNVIVTFKAINPEVLNNVLNYLEKYYIKKFNTYKDGYNLTLGGEGTCGWKASEETKAKMSEAQKGHPTSDKVRETNRVIINNLELWKCNYSPILQYDSNGRFLKRYDSLIFAAEEIKKELAIDSPIDTIRGTISRAKRGNKGYTRRKTAYGYLWEPEDPNNFRLFIDVPENKTYKPLYYYKKDGTLIAEYKNVYDASKATGIDTKTLNTLCYVGDAARGERPRRKEFYWSRKAPAT